jgi:hypothetical protein
MNLQRSLEIWEASQCSLCGKTIEQDALAILEFHFHRTCAKEVGELLQKIKQFEQFRPTDDSEIKR